jgi:hypothetical protein
VLDLQHVSKHFSDIPAVDLAHVESPSTAVQPQQSGKFNPWPEKLFSRWCELFEVPMR